MFCSSRIRVPEVPFHFFDKLKYEIRNKILVFVSMLKLRHKKRKTNWFFDFQNNRTLKFKLEVRFSFFTLVWKTKNQIYLNKYLMKLVTRSHYAITINKYKYQIALMIKHQIFVNKHLPVQTQRKVDISKRYSICSNLLIKLLQ